MSEWRERDGVDRQIQEGGRLGNGGVSEVGGLSVQGEKRA